MLEDPADLLAALRGTCLSSLPEDLLVFPYVISREVLSEQTQVPCPRLSHGQLGPSEHEPCHE